MYADESWEVDAEGFVSTSSFISGVMGFSEESGQYVKHVHYSSKELGQLVAVEFTVDEDLLDAVRSVCK